MDGHLAALPFASKAFNTFSEVREELYHIAQFTQPGQDRMDFGRTVTLSQNSYVAKQKMRLLLTVFQALCPTSWSTFPQRNIMHSSINYSFPQLFFVMGEIL